MLKKLKFYIIGLVLGLIVVFFVLNKKGATCKGYLPNSRVIAETLSKEFVYSQDVTSQMNQLNIDEKFLKDSIITEGNIDFDRSNAQKEPCPEYLLIYPKDNPRYELNFEKCKENVTLKELKKLD